MKTIKSYIYDNRWIFLMGCIAFYLIHGNQIFSDAIKVDTVNMILEPHSTINWLGIGRFGAIAIRWLLECGLNFNPYYSTALGMIFYVLAMIAFSYLFEKLTSIPAIYTVVMYLVFMSHPIWAEQFYFQLQVLPFAVAMLLIPIVILLQLKAYLEEKLILYVPCIVFLVLIFGTYQSFVCIYITVVMFCTMMYARKVLMEHSSRSCSKNIFGFLFRYLIVFTIAIIIYQVLAQGIFGIEKYLSSQMKSRGWSSTLYLWKDNVDMILVGEGFFYNCAYLISGSLALVAFIYDLLKQKWKIGWKLLYLCLIGLLELMIISMTMVTNNVPMFRVQIYLPLVIGINFLYVLSVIKEYKKLARGVFVIAVGIILFQTQSLYQLYYTNHIQYQHDMRMFTLLSYDIERIMGIEEQPVFFIGTVNENKDTYPNNVYRKGEVIGTSFFGFNSWDTPHYYYSTIQITRFFQANNYEIEYIEKSKVVEAREKAEKLNMPIWPADGSIVNCGEYTIVKIAEDEYYEEDFAQK